MSEDCPICEARQERDAALEAHAELLEAAESVVNDGVWVHGTPDLRVCGWAMERLRAAVGA